MSEDNETSQEKKQKPDQIEDAKIVRKVVLIIISSIVLIMVIGGISSYFYISSALKPVNPKSEEKVEIEIPLGSSNSEIAKILEQNGIIKDQRIFRFYLKFKNYAGFQAGDYTLSPSLTLNEIITELQSGKIVDEPLYKITIPEGKTVEQIAEIYSNQFNFEKEEFLKVANNEDYLKELIKLYPNVLTDDILDSDIKIPLEGYLFALTYEFYEEDPTIESIIELMIDQTDNFFSGHSEIIQEQETTVHDVLTLASIVERESKFSEDRPKVAQVFYNRLNNNMKLQSDITAAYANGEHKVLMTYDDVNVQSPYNTYVVDKLPIGPISSPSIESIQAVLEPEGNDFEALYFYARPNGETLYTSSLEEHVKIKEKYEKEWHDLEEANKSNED